MVVALRREVCRNCAVERLVPVSGTHVAEVVSGGIGVCAELAYPNHVWSV